MSGVERAPEETRHDGRAEPVANFDRPDRRAGAVSVWHGHIDPCAEAGGWRVDAEDTGADDPEPVYGAGRRGVCHGDHSVVVNHDSSAGGIYLGRSDDDGAERRRDSGREYWHDNHRADPGIRSNCAGVTSVIAWLFRFFTKF